MFTPMPVPNSGLAELGELRARILVLEQALMVALSQLSATGVSAENLDSARNSVAEIGQLVANGKAPEAARHYREFFGVTWDEAHAAVARWQSSRCEELARGLCLRRWLDAQGDKH